MDERLLFERIHEALDVDPRPAGYERMRSALIAKTSTPRRRAGFQLRWNKMGFRLAAAIVLVAVAVTAGAVFFATHQVAQSNIPAGPRAAAAYQKLVLGDDAALDAALAAGCNAEIACADGVSRVGGAFRKWLADLDAVHAPARFAVIDGQMRIHLNAALSALNAGVAAANAMDDNAQSAAMAAQTSEQSWLDTVASRIASSKATTASAYADLVNTERLSVSSCAACRQLTDGEKIACLGDQSVVCEGLAVGAEAEVGLFQAELVRNAAPNSLAFQDQRLQSDLAAASSAVVDLSLASVGGDQTGFDTGRVTLARALSAVDQDCTAILGT